MQRERIGAREHMGAPRRQHVLVRPCPHGAMRAVERARQRQPADRGAGCRGNLRGHACKRVGNTLDRRMIEQLARIAHDTFDPAGQIRHIETDVEAGRVVVECERRHRQTAGQRVRDERQLLREFHLEQRIGRQAAVRLQGFDNLLERHVLVRVRVQHRLLGVGEQRVERQLGRRRRADHQRVDEETDQRRDFGARPVRARHADADIGLAAQAREHGVKNRQQNVEQRGVARQRERAQLRRECGRQREAQPRAGEALHRAARTVGRERQARAARAELLAPVAELALEHARAGQIALPQRVVGIGDR